MSWNEVDTKHKRRYDGFFVSCEEKYERDYIKQIVKEEFPYLSDQQILQSIDHCCKMIPANRPRAIYWQCMKNYLGIN